MGIIPDKYLSAEITLPWKTGAVAAVLTGLVTFVVFLPALASEFVNWDDYEYVFENQHIQAPLRNVPGWAFLNFYAGNWHPLAWLSHALDYTVWGLDPFGHHLTNNVLHAVNAMLVVLVCMRLLESNRSTGTDGGPSVPAIDERGVLIAGATAGLLFGIHPVHVESVAWVSERKDVLSALFFLLSILSYLFYRSNKSYKTYFLTFIFFMLALMSKPMAVTLPAVLVILDWYPFQKIRSLRTFLTAVMEKAPFFALSIASAVITIRAEDIGDHIVPFEASSFSERLIIGCDAVFSYLHKMLLPLRLNPFYPYPTNVSLFSPEYFLAVLVVSGITLTCIMLIYRKQKIWAAAWGYYLVTLLPVLGLVRVGYQSMADRYTYLPSLGPFLVLGLAAARGYEALGALKKRGLRQDYIGVVIASILLVSLSLLTVRQIKIWKNSIVFWTYVIENNDQKIPLALASRGRAYNTEGEYDLAIQDLNAALALRPSFFTAIRNRGVAYENKGMHDKAIEDFDRAIRQKPDNFEVFNNRGLVYDHKGMHDKAIEDFTRAIRLKPDNFEAFNNRGVAYAGKELIGNAKEDFGRALALKPDYFEALCNLGMALKLDGQYERAAESYTRAIRLDGGNAAAYINRADVRLKSGDAVSAVSDFRKACELGSEAGCREYKKLTGR